MFLHTKAKKAVAKLVWGRTPLSVAADLDLEVDFAHKHVKMNPRFSAALR
jgi:hypothetical protein